jgi:hypothetical protein
VLPVVVVTVVLVGLSVVCVSAWPVVGEVKATEIPVVAAPHAGGLHSHKLSVALQVAPNPSRLWQETVFPQLSVPPQPSIGLLHSFAPQAREVHSQLDETHVSSDPRLQLEEQSSVPRQPFA